MAAAAPVGMGHMLRLHVLTVVDLDLVVIGGGPGGYVAAIKAGQLGLKVYSVILNSVSSHQTM